MSDLIEGRRPVIEALRAGRPINRIVLARDVRRHSTIAELLDLARRAKVPLEWADPRAIKRLSVTGHSQGVVALAATRAYDDLDSLLAETKRRGEPALYVLLDGIEDPHNLGAVLRTADAAGVHGVVVPARRAAGLTSAVARASAGAVESVLVARVQNLSRAMKQLGNEHVWTIGVDPAGKRDYTEVDYRQPTAIVVGSEGKGLSRLVKERCDLLASIPMAGRIASLNASVAAALVMYEARRQRAAEAVEAVEAAGPPQHSGPMLPRLSRPASAPRSAPASGRSGRASPPRRAIEGKVRSRPASAPRSAPASGRSGKTSPSRRATEGRVRSGPASAPRSAPASGRSRKTSPSRRHR